MKKDMKMILYPAVALIIFGLIGWYLYQPTNDKNTANEPTTASSVPLIRDGNYTIGNKDAKVTVVEFFDPECEACAAFHPILKEVLKDFSAEVFFVGRYMLYHGNSHNAAIALEAAGAQGKYWEFQDILFTRQEQWSHRKDSPMSIFEKYAEELKLDLNTFKTSLDDTTLKQKIAQDVADGQQLGVRGTPSFFINGKPLMTLSNEGLRDAIAEALKNQK